jgi:5'-nucleotidase
MVSSRNTDKLHILITNDDGYDNPGILTLAEHLKDNYNLTIIAPDKEKSATSHSVSFFKPIGIKEIKSVDGIPSYAIDGTPADCVKFGLNHLLKDNRPNYIISGINHGENTGIDILYSGTVSAAVEGATHNIPSLAVSVPRSETPRFDTASEVTGHILKSQLLNEISDNFVLNINIPNISKNELKGIAITRQSDNQKINYFEKINQDDGYEYYIMKRFDEEQADEGLDVDRSAVFNNYVSITPLNINRTNLDNIALLKRLNFNL